MTSSTKLQNVHEEDENDIDDNNNSNDINDNHNINDNHANHNGLNKTTKKRRRIFVCQNLLTTLKL